ncbi:MAG: AI-2E family transporter [Micrococcaceae bacterium]
MADNDDAAAEQTPAAGAPRDPRDSTGAAPSAPSPTGADRVRALRRRLSTFRVPGARPRHQFSIPESTPASAPPASESANDVATAMDVTVLNPIRTGFLFTVGIGLALSLYLIATLNSSLLIWIGAALFIALGLDPIVRKVESWGAPRGVGVLGALAIFGGILGLFFSLLIPIVARQTTQFINDLPTLVDQFIASEFFQDLDARYDVQEWVNTELNRFVSDASNVTNLFGGIFGVGTAIVTTGFSALVIFVLTLYFLVSLPTIKQWMYHLVPRSRRDRVETLSERITTSVGHYVIGQSIVAALNGGVAFIAVSIAGVPFAALMAFFAGLMAFIPLVGAMIGGIIISLISLAVGWQAALIFAVIYFVYLQVEAYFVSPRVMSRAVAVPSSVAVIAVIAGGTMLGVLGALIAIPTAAAVLLLLREVLLPYQDSR